METKSESQVIDNKNEETICVFDKELSTDLNSTQMETQYYDWIRCLFTILTSVGFPLNNWLKIGDPLGSSNEKKKIFWTAQRIFFWVSTHSALVLILLSFLIVRESEGGIDISGHLTLLSINFTSVYLLDFYYYLCWKNIPNILISPFNETENPSPDRNGVQPTTNSIANNVDVFTSMALPVLLALILFISLPFGFVPIIWTLTALNLTTISINFLIVIKFCSFLNYRLKELDINVKERIKKRDYSAEWMKFYLHR